jgi:hypothetical protein
MPNISHVSRSCQSAPAKTFVQVPMRGSSSELVEWRASLSDDAWVDWNAVADEEWYDAVERDFGLDARQGNKVRQ